MMEAEKEKQSLMDTLLTWIRDRMDHKVQINVHCSVRTQTFQTPLSQKQGVIRIRPARK